MLPVVSVGRGPEHAAHQDMHRPSADNACPLPVTTGEGVKEWEKVRWKCECVSWRVSEKVRSSVQ